MSSQGDLKWDGRQHSYRSGPDWRSRVPAAVPFHTEVDEDLDPVTYEVIRNRLWNTNMAHGETLTRISGNPTFQGLDFGISVLTEDAEIVMNGPFIVYLASGADDAIRYAIEHYGESPGIRDGDMFAANDPWIGAVHQMDVLVSCPVFVDGKIFAWVANAAHQYDLGGIVPGGWPQNATDVFSDPVIFRPFKLVEGGEMRPDLEAMYLRQSRMPDLLALDLRAQIAGAKFAAGQMLEICEEFGPATVKAAMRRNLDNAQRQMQEKLSRIPDGTWSQVRYVDQKLPGDRGTYRLQVNVTKKGDRLIVDNEGTDEQQDGPIGFVYTSFAGAFLGVSAVTLLWEQMFSTGGAARQIDFRPTPGLLSCVDFPAPVSGGVMNIVVHMNALQMIFTRMLAGDPELRRDATGAQVTWPLLVLSGVDDRGVALGTALFEPPSMGSAAHPDRDGDDTAGAAWSPLMRVLNMESLEQYFPMVYLYRREREDSSGPGRFRGGSSTSYGVVPYRAEQLEAITNVGGMGASADGGGLGIFGGYPTPTSGFLVKKGSDVRKVFADRRLPVSVDELQSEESFLLPGKSDGTELTADDALEGFIGGGGGYGDPLDREPGSVATDVDLGYVSGDAARDVYGVALDADGAVDGAATEALRAAMRSERAAWPPATELPPGEEAEGERLDATGEEPRAVSDYVVARDLGGERVLACAVCDTRLSGYRGNYKLGLLVDQGPLTAIPLGPDPSLFLDDEIVFRRYCCPGCHTLMTTEIVRADEPAPAEVRFA